MDYKEQIKSPKWQKRRLEILQRDGFTCQVCGCKDKTLHVHHTVYIKDHNIWEYKDNQLITLCEECHEYEHMMEESINEKLWYIKKRGVLNHEISALLDIIDVNMHFGNQNVIKDIVGNGYLPEIEREYIKLLAERRSLIDNSHIHGKTY